MTTPVRIQRKRTKGYDMQAESRAINGLECVYVGRPTIYGNPWKVGSQGIKDNREATDLFREHIRGRYLYPNLRGKNLACWCAITSQNNYCPCHADVLLSIINEISMEEVISENIRWSKRKAM